MFEHDEHALDLKEFERARTIRGCPRKGLAWSKYWTRLDFVGSEIAVLDGNTKQ